MELTLKRIRIYLAIFFFLCSCSGKDVTKQVHNDSISKPPFYNDTQNILKTGLYLVVQQSNTDCIVDTLEKKPDETICIERKPAVTIENFKTVRTYSFEMNGDTITNLNIRLDNKGTKVFDKFTGNNIGKRIALVINGRAIMAPVVEARIFSGSITIGSEQNWTPKELDNLKSIINYELFNRKLR